MQPQHILAPVDFSSDAMLAARFGLSLAERYGAALTLFYVDKLPAFSERMAERVAADVWAKYVQDRSRVVQQRLDEVAQELGGGRIDTALARDHVAVAIAGYVAEHGDDLVVMAPHGVGTSTHFLLGSVTSDVAANAACPVLVTRQHQDLALPHDGAFRRLLVAVPVGGIDEEMVSWARALAAPGAHIELFHAFESGERGLPWPDFIADALKSTRAALRNSMDETAGRLEQEGFEASAQLTRGDAANELLERISGQECDAVLVGRRSPRGRAGVLGSVAQRLLRHADVPVVVTRAG